MLLTSNVSAWAGFEVEPVDAEFANEAVEVQDASLLGTLASDVEVSAVEWKLTTTTPVIISGTTQDLSGGMDKNVEVKVTLNKDPEDDVQVSLYDTTGRTEVAIVGATATIGSGETEKTISVAAKELLDRKVTLKVDTAGVTLPVAVTPQEVSFYSSTKEDYVDYNADSSGALRESDFGTLEWPTLTTGWESVKTTILDKIGGVGGVEIADGAKVAKIVDDVPPTEGYPIALANVSAANGKYVSVETTVYT